MRNVQVICQRSLFWGYSLERRISDERKKKRARTKIIWGWNLKMFGDLNVMFQANTTKEQNK